MTFGGRTEMSAAANRVASGAAEQRTVVGSDFYKVARRPSATPRHVDGGVNREPPECRGDVLAHQWLGIVQDARWQGYVLCVANIAQHGGSVSIHATQFCTFDLRRP